MGVEDVVMMLELGYKWTKGRNSATPISLQMICIPNLIMHVQQGEDLPVTRYLNIPNRRDQGGGCMYNKHVLVK
jgi:hypothetical protein